MTSATATDTRRGSGASDVLGGVTLEQFAGVLAALSEGFALQEILAQECIARDTWPQAERAWRSAIADSPALQIELVQKKRVAEDSLARRVEPLDGDPAAWVGLLGALATADDPNACVARFGITMNDVSRIGRTWRRKCEGDAELGKKLEELAPDAKPPASVTAAPLELRPFPWTPASQRKAPPAPSKPADEPAAAPLPEAVELRREARMERASYQLGGPPAVVSAAPPRPSYLAAEVQPPAPAPPAPLTASSPRPTAVTFTNDPFSGTAALPTPEVLQRLIVEASPEAALAKAGADPHHRPLVVAPPKEGPVGSGTAITPVNLAELAATVMPFRDAPGPSRSAGDARTAAPAATSTPSSSAPSPPSPFQGDPFSGTAALPTAAIVQLLIAEAQPRAAMAKHEPAPPPSRSKDEPPPAHIDTGTEAVDPNAVRAALAAYEAERYAATPSNTAAPGGIDIATLAAIAVDIRTGTWPAHAVAARGLSDGAWRAAQAAVVSDPEKRRAFEAEIADQLRRRPR